jgi:hypothetical protein
VQFLDTPPGGDGSPQTTVKIVSGSIQDPVTLPNGQSDPASLQPVSAGVPVNAVININGTFGAWLLAWTGAPVPPNFCTVLVHALAHAADMMSGSSPSGTCQLDGGQSSGHRGEGDGGHEQLSKELGTERRPGVWPDLPAR